MTDEDKKIVADYMGWKMSEWMIIDGSAHVVNPHFFDLNDAGLVVQEMQKRGDWVSFLDYTELNAYGAVIWYGFISKLFNADNFFSAFVQWRNGK